MTIQQMFLGTSGAEPPAPVAIELLLVAGGGGTQQSNVSWLMDDNLAPSYQWCPGGGGGGGGVKIFSYTIPVNGTVYLAVGAGASGNARGSNSYAGATAGGADIGLVMGGGSGVFYSAVNGGGSGGGAGASQYYTQTGGAGTAGQGNNGGNSIANASGGGGGAGGAGATATTNIGGAGGAGYNQASFDGGAAFYLGAGGGGAGSGGQATNGSGVTAALANSGVGAKSGVYGVSTPTAGGSGVIIVRYAGTTQKLTGGATYTGTVGGNPYFFHKFTGTGTLANA